MEFGTVGRDLINGSIGCLLVEDGILLSEISTDL